MNATFGWLDALILGLVQHAADLVIGLVHILLLGLHQLLSLGELAGQLVLTTTLFSSVTIFLWVTVLRAMQLI